MKIPKGLQPLIDDGVIDAVLRSLKSGKEASVYVVRSGRPPICLVPTTSSSPSFVIDLSAL